MPTILDLLSLPSVRPLDGYSTYEALERFVHRYDRLVAEAMEDRLGYETSVMQRIGVDIVIEGREREGNRDEGLLHYLGRLTFDGLAVALIRFDGSRRKDSEQRWTVRLTDKSAADRMVEAIVQVLGDSLYRLHETGSDCDAGALLDFGVNAVLGVATCSLSFLESERLLLLTHETPLMVLARVEDGRFMFGHAEHGDDIFEMIADAESAVSTFRSALDQHVAKPLGRSPLILHGRNDAMTVGLVSDRSGQTICSTIEGRSEIVERARGDEAAAEFLVHATALLDEACTPARKARRGKRA